MDILRKTLLAGVGLAWMTREKIEELAQKLSAEGQTSAEEGKKFVEDLIGKAEEARRGIEAQVQTAVRKAIEGMHLPTRERIEAIEKRLSALEQRQNG